MRVNFEYLVHTMKNMTETVSMLAARIRKLEVQGFASTSSFGVYSQLTVNAETALTSSRQIDPTDLLAFVDNGAGNTYEIGVDSTKLEWTSGKLTINATGTAIVGAGAANHVAVFTGSYAIAHDLDQLYWDTTNNRLGIGTNSPTARLHLPAGTTSASSAPLKFTSGTSMTAAEAGAMEYTTDDLFFTINTGTARKRLLLADPSGGLTSGRVPFATTNGRLTDDADFTYVSDVLILKKSGVTDEGGYYVTVVAGENLSRGEVVEITQGGGADGKVYKNPIDGNMPVGVVYADVLSNADVKIIVSGIAYVLPESGVTATRGYVLYSSNAEAGRVDQSATITANPSREIGHFLEDGSGNGAITRAILHFN